MWRLAKQYVEVGATLRGTSAELSDVRYFLLCHGVELALKAF
jgi:hypothetical protein